MDIQTVAYSNGMWNNGILLSKTKNEPLVHLTTWKNLNKIMMSERSKTKKKKKKRERVQIIYIIV